MDVALVTCAALPGLWADDRLLLHALRERGVDVEPVVWEDPHFDWRSVALCVVRSVWDYAYRRDSFLGWADRVASTTSMWTSSNIIRWNTHKQYLCDLAAAGVPTVPTLVLRRGESASLSDILAERAWSDVVIKADKSVAFREVARVIQSASKVDGIQIHVAVLEVD